jgi:ATP-dependent RNA helicase SUPV3L1/SUV3
MVSAEVTSGGDLSFEGQIVGRLQGFRFTPEANPDAERARIDDGEIANATAQEFEVRANRLSEAVDAALVLANDGAIRWLGDPVAKIASGEKLLAPRALILADESLSESAQQKVQGRVDLWLSAYVRRLLGPLFDLEAAAGLEGPARNVALQLAEALGVLERGRVSHDVKALDQNARGMLRKLGARFGAYYIYIPSLVKPATRVLATQLWALRQDGEAVGAGLDEIPQLAASGRTSFLADHAISKETYRVAGFRLCGDRAVRVDIVERLADLIRPAVAYRPGPNAGAPPAGAADGDGFVVTGAMTSLTGCSGEPFASVLRSLGFASHRVKGPALTVVAPTAPGAPSANEQAEIATEAEAASGAATAAEGESQGAGDTETHEPEAAADAESRVVAVESPSADALLENGSLPPSDTAPRDAEAAADAERGLPAADAERAVEPSAAREAPPVDEAVRLEGEVEQGALSSGPEAASPPPIVLEGEASDQAVAPAEEILIEVWRPRPPPNRQRNPRAGSREKVAARPQEAAEGDQRPRRDGAVERTGRRRNRPAHAPAPQVGAEAGSQAEPQPPREETNRFKHGRGPRRFDSANKPEGGAGRRGAPNRGGQDERKQDDRRHENTSASPPRREPSVNLNSPFAKLLALKSQLEAKAKE